LTQLNALAACDLHKGSASRMCYAYGSIRSSSGTLQTDRTYTGQKSDGTGLLYYNARYYDPALGTFLSPDTLVPDAGRVIDYNRFLYVRGNPLKYTDPSGHYTNNEIMQHYGCEDWACVEALYQRGSGSNVEGLWGWLYMLQMAEDGYGITGGQIVSNHRVSGIFQRAANGRIEVLHNGNTLPDWVMARMGADRPTMGHTGWYSLDTGEYRSVTTWSTTKHNFLYISPGQLTVIGLKAGTGFGPAIMAAAPATGPASPIVAGAGAAYTGIGWGTTLIVDFVVPLSQKDWHTPSIAVGVEAFTQALVQRGVNTPIVADAVRSAYTSHAPRTTHHNESWAYLRRRVLVALYIVV